MSEPVWQINDLLLIAATVAYFALWTRLLTSVRRQPGRMLEGLVPLRPRGRPFWSLADALVMFGIQLVMMTLLQLAFSNSGWTVANPDPEAPPLLSPLAAALLTIASGLGAATVTLVWLSWIGGQAFGRLQLHPTSKDVWLGLKASILVLPGVLALSGLVHSIFPYSHPVLDLLRQVDSAAVFVVMFIATGIVTPFVEEFLFRVLLQGGLQTMLDDAAPDELDYRPRSYAPIFVTSAIFALMHVGQGAAPIPLFFLSLALGYLYRQTGNITAPLVVHTVLNSLTLIVVFTETAGR